MELLYIDHTVRTLRVHNMEVYLGVGDKILKETVALPINVQSAIQLSQRGHIMVYHKPSDVETRLSTLVLQMILLI